MELVAAVRRNDWDMVRLRLHPYLHWYTSGGEVRGRDNVLAMLRSGRARVAPSAYELRDGQIYRWWDT